MIFIRMSEFAFEIKFIGMEGERKDCSSLSLGVERLHTPYRDSTRYDQECRANKRCWDLCNPGPAQDRSRLAPVWHALYMKHSAELYSSLFLRLLSRRFVNNSPSRIPGLFRSPSKETSSHMYVCTYKVNPGSQSIQQTRETI